MRKSQNKYNYVYIENLMNAKMRAAKWLLNVWEKLISERKRMNEENFNVMNNKRMLFWKFNRKIAVAARHSIETKDVIIISMLVKLLIKWVSEWIM